MAKFQYKEIIGLFELGAFMRPKHEAAINQYLAENWKPLEEPIANKDFAAFEQAFHAADRRGERAITSSREAVHHRKLPETPPLDLDLRLRAEPARSRTRPMAPQDIRV